MAVTRWRKAGQVRQGADTRQEEILPSLDGHEPRKIVDPIRGRQAWDRKRAAWRIIGIVGAHKRIAFVRKPSKTGIVDPVLMNELELTLEIAVETKEQQTKVSIAFHSVGPPATKDPVPVPRQLSEVCRGGVARVRATDVRPDRAAVAEWVVRKAELVIVGAHVR